MMAYKAGLKGRIAFAWGCAGLLLVVALVFVFVLELNVADDLTKAFIQGMQTGLFAMLMVLAVTTAVRYTRAMRDEALLRKLFIAETDERSRLIRDKIGNVGLNLVLVLLASATLVAGYFDTTVFYTLLAATAACAFTKAGLKVYFRRKY